MAPVLLWERVERDHTVPVPQQRVDGFPLRPPVVQRQLDLTPSNLIDVEHTSKELRTAQIAIWHYHPINSRLAILGYADEYGCKGPPGGSAWIAKR